VAWRYLPRRYFYSTAVLWSFQYLKVTNFKLNQYFKAWKAVSAIPRQEKRRPVSKEALAYLKKVKARLAY
jgi:hypothetical protein